MEFKIGLNSISNYKRLSYSPWHAIAEFVDNSTQSYFDNKNELDRLPREPSATPLTVGIVYKRRTPTFRGSLRVTDNAMGMSSEDLERAMHVALPPANSSGRSKYGMGLKTAASWMGNTWRITTKKLGESVGYAVDVDVVRIADGDSSLDVTEIADLPQERHYTTIEIFDHNREFHGRTISNIKQYLGSMYREDFRAGDLTLLWGNEALRWDFDDEKQYLVSAATDDKYRQTFDFQIQTDMGEFRRAHGWVGILEAGSRAKAGFSILCARRVIKGYPDSWRPWSLYGQIQGSNDLVNQRLIGEIHLDDFEVSHTKDQIIWAGNEEELVNEELRKKCSNYKGIAQQYRKTSDDPSGPSEAMVDTAISEMQEELRSSQLHLWATSALPLTEALIQESKEVYVRSVTGKIPARFTAQLAGGLLVRGYVEDMSVNDPYLVVDHPLEGKVDVIVNKSHPHWKQLSGTAGVLNFLRHCVYDGIAESRAHEVKAQSITVLPDTIKTIKDKLLRIPFEIEQDAQESSIKEVAD